MSGAVEMIVVLALLGALGAVSGTVTQCYHCNSEFCGDNYDTRLGAIASCSDLYKNIRTASSQLISLNETQKDLEEAESIETLDHDSRLDTHANIFDIERKFWDFFNKGEVDQYTQFVCVKAFYNSGNGNTKTYRGCVPKSTRSISTACEYVNQKVSGASTGNIYGCYTCDSNLCNSGISLRTSMLVLALGIMLKIVF